MTGDIKVKIVGAWWTIRYVEEVPRGRFRRSLRGLCDLEEKIIYVQRHPSLRERRTTLVHEILHAYFPDATERRVEMVEDTLFELGLI